MSNTNVAIIGKIPGYGITLDKGNNFGKILLRDITYIDMIPATYTINPGMLGAGEDLSNFYVYDSGNKDTSVYAIFKGVIAEMVKYTKVSFKTIAKNHPILSEESLLKLAEPIFNNWKRCSSVRILGANDSTFTETISNNFTDNNSGSDITAKGTALGQKTMDSFLPSINKALGGQSVIGKMQSMSYGSALDALTNASTHSGLVSLLSGRMLGVQFATPNVWQSSSYNSTLSLFIKLAAPSGDPASILNYITIPILTMMATGAPITRNGVTYAMPLVWDVRAYGITHFKIGAVAAMAISRGSYETVFNSSKQPMLVDVRLTIVPLMQDFAVQYNGTGTKGSSTAKTIATGIDNLKELTKEQEELKKVADEAKKKISGAASYVMGTDIGQNIEMALKAMSHVFTQISKEVDAAVSTKGDGNKSIYGDSGLGVQSPGDEIDGLSGLNYEGLGSAKRTDYMIVDDYEYKEDEKADKYYNGFANSYTFRI